MRCVYTVNANLVAAGVRGEGRWCGPCVSVELGFAIAGVTWRSLVMWSFTVRSGGEARVRERMDCSSRVCRERSEEVV